MNIKDIRVVQKLRKGTRLKKVDGDVVVEQFVEKTSWALQIKRDGFGAEWENIQVIEEFEEDV